MAFIIVGSEERANTLCTLLSETHTAVPSSKARRIVAGVHAALVLDTRLDGAALVPLLAWLGEAYPRLSVAVVVSAGAEMGLETLRNLAEVVFLSQAT
jgi:hypothetical protein